MLFQARLGRCNTIREAGAGILNVNVIRAVPRVDGTQEKFTASVSR